MRGLGALARAPEPRPPRDGSLPRTVAVLDDEAARGLAPHLDLWRIDTRGVGTDVARIDPELCVIATFADGEQRAWRAHGQLTAGPARRLLGLTAERGIPTAIWDADGTSPAPPVGARRFALRPSTAAADPLAPAVMPSEHGPAAGRLLQGSHILRDRATRAELHAARSAAVLRVLTDDRHAVAASLIAAAGGAAIVAPIGSWIAELLGDAAVPVADESAASEAAEGFEHDAEARHAAGRDAWTAVARSHRWEDRAHALRSLGPMQLPSLRVVLTAADPELDRAVDHLRAQRLEGVVGEVEVVVRGRRQGEQHAPARLAALAARTGLTLRSEALHDRVELVASVDAGDRLEADHLADLALLVNRLGAGPVAARAREHERTFARTRSVRASTWLATWDAAEPLLRQEDRGARELEVHALLAAAAGLRRPAAGSVG